MRVTLFLLLVGTALSAAAPKETDFAAEETGAEVTFDLLTTESPDYNETTLEHSTFPPSNCRYYCIYNGTGYCCDDNTRPLPENHDTKPGRCVDEEYHICKENGIEPSIYVEFARTPVEKLFTGSPKAADPCASDGYCGFGEKCCPTPCGRKHLCLKAEYYSCRYYCAFDSKAYCCDDGTLVAPKDHSDHEGFCPDMEDEVCDDVKVPIKTAGKKNKSNYRLCASDGYCKADERCCPSKCAQRHVCTKAIRIVEEVDFNNLGKEDQYLDF